MSNTNKIIPLRRKAKASDYKWSEEFQSYVLTWADRLGRGVVCASPEEGAKEYNLAIPSRIENKKVVEQRLAALVNECLAVENERTEGVQNSVSV